jgi:hypothetical protein
MEEVIGLLDPLRGAASSKLCFAFLLPFPAAVSGFFFSSMFYNEFC